LQTTLDFGDAQVTFDVRNLPTPPEGAVPPQAAACGQGHRAAYVVPAGA